MAKARYNSDFFYMENRALDNHWNIEKADELYKISAWGGDYFHLNPKGELCVKVPFKEKSASVSLMQIVDNMASRGKSMPVLLRVQNLIENQIKELNESFAKAIAENDYQGTYQGVFPIKVNQQAHVIKDIVHFGSPYHHGLEAGSKAELMIAFSMLKDPQALIVCNGYKDSEFVELGLRMSKLGYQVVFVIETPAELPIIIKCAKITKIDPIIGIRAKLFSKISGHWNATSGDRSMFGLTASQMVEVVDELKKANMLNCLQFLHYHLGSQIPHILNVQLGVQEACQYYIDLVSEGAPMKYLDLGGGLAVDYDGTKSSQGHSRNYTMQEYCTDIVYTIKRFLDKKNIAHPTIVTESGRATVAYSTILMFNILDVTGFGQQALPQLSEEDLENELIKDLIEAHELLKNKRHAQEAYHDALLARDRARGDFLRTECSLRTRAKVEQIFMFLMNELAKIAKENPKALENPEHFKTMLSDIYYGNFSVFQSLPDAWAIDQIFPVAPLHRHLEEPTRHAVIADITCDSDGRIDRFTHNGQLERTLLLHELRDLEQYYLGVFLVGAYQETLGDLHNLLGDTHAVSVYIDEDGTCHFSNEVEGDTVADVLNYVEYQSDVLLDRFKEEAQKALAEKKITLYEYDALNQLFEDGFKGYTYFEQ